MLNLNPTYILIAEVIFSNIGGTATGNVTINSVRTATKTVDLQSFCRIVANIKVFYAAVLWFVKFHPSPLTVSKKTEPHSFPKVDC